MLVNPAPSAVTVTAQMPTYPPALSSFQANVSSGGSYWRGSRRLVKDGQVVLTVPGPGVATLYGVGLNADASSAVGVPAISRGGNGQLQMVFIRDRSRDELSYVVEASDSLGASDWTAMAMSTGGNPFVTLGGAVVTESGTDVIKTVTLLDASADGSKERFLRVRVTN